MSRVGGFFDGVGRAFRDGWHNARNGDFGKMDIWQGLAVGLSGLIIAYAVISLAEVIWEKIKDFVPYVLAGLAILAGLFLLSKFIGNKDEPTAGRPDPARRDPRRTSMLLDDPAERISPEVRRLVMREVDSTQLAMLDPEVASGLRLDQVTLRDGLPRRAEEAEVTRTARDTLTLMS